MVGTMRELLKRMRTRLEYSSLVQVKGRVEQAVGTLVESSGPPAAVGDLCVMNSADGAQVAGEVVGFRGKRLLLMPLGNIEGLTSGCGVEVVGDGLTYGFSEGLIGRVIDGLGNPLDASPLPVATSKIPFDRPAPSALQRPACAAHQSFVTLVRPKRSLA